MSISLFEYDEEKEHAKELINNHVPYSDMTNEEIEAVINFKAELIANNAVNTANYELLKNEISIRNERQKQIMQAKQDMFKARQKDIKKKYNNKMEESLKIIKNIDNMLNEWNEQDELIYE